MLPRLQRIDGWQREVAEIASDLGVTPQAILLAFQQYDEKASAAGTLAPMPPQTVEVRDFREYVPGGPTQVRTRVREVESGVQELVEHVLLWMAPTPAKAKAKRPRRTKEAIRKAKARAEGRVKPRARKGPPSVEARIASTEKELATRRATLMELKADPTWTLTNGGAVMRCEAGIVKTEKKLATYQARLRASAKQP